MGPNKCMIEAYSDHHVIKEETKSLILFPATRNLGVTLRSNKYAPMHKQIDILDKLVFTVSLQKYPFIIMRR